MYKTTLTPELQVTNFSKSLDFYINLVGFEILYDRPETKFAMLGMNGCRIMIEEIEPNGRWSVGKLEKPFGRGMHFQIEVNDADKLYERFINNKYPIFFEMEEKWYRLKNKEVGNRQFLVQDPDGYLFRFFKDLGERNISD